MHRSTPPLVRLFGIAAALLLLAAACGDSDDTNTESSTDTAAATTAAGAGPAETTATSMSDLLGDYVLVDDDFGTMVTVTVSDGVRTIVSNALPDHETGDFPNSGNPNTISAQDLTWEFPAEGTYVGNAVEARTTGVAVNGVKFEPGTAETLTCESGETYRIEGLQEVYDLGFDFNNAHVQPTGEYHYHGVSDLLVDAYAADDDLVLIGFAADGFLMYHSKSDAYRSSYALSSQARTGTSCVASGPDSTTIDVAGATPDGTYTADWIFTEGSGDLDICNGTTVDGEYLYIVTDEYPFVSRCLNGESSGEQNLGAAPPGAGAPTPGG